MNEESVIFFEEYLSGFVGKALIPNLFSISTAFTIDLGHGVDRWGLAIEKGTLTEIRRGGISDGSFTYRLGSDTFLNIVSGEQDPRMAFFTGKVKIDGDMVQALKVATVLSEFFSKYPYKVRGEES